MPPGSINNLATDSADSERQFSLALNLVTRAPAWRKYNKHKAWSKIFTGIADTAVEIGLMPTVACSVEVLLADDTLLAQLNQSYRNIATPTDVLAFPDGSKHAGCIQLGEIAISWQQVRQQAIAENVRIIDRVSHLFCHALLHLCGFDHHDQAQAKIMEGYEARILSKHGFANPYAGAVSLNEN